MKLRELYVAFADADTTETEIIARDENGTYQTIYEHGTLENFYEENFDVEHWKLLEREVFWFDFKDGKMRISLKKEK